MSKRLMETVVSSSPRLALLLVLSCFSIATLGYGQAMGDNVWILVNTRSSTLSVMRGNTLLESFSNIAIGKGGAAWRKRQGDNKTPVGNFKVAWINKGSKFYRFFGLDYPNREHSDRAYREGRLTRKMWSNILDAHNNDEVPPQDTPLGGYIGIHGVGRGDPRIHEQFNWTNGCIALYDEQIDRLAKWIRVGTPVIVR